MLPCIHLFVLLKVRNVKCINARPRVDETASLARPTRVPRVDETASLARPTRVPRVPQFNVYNPIAGPMNLNTTQKNANPPAPYSDA